MQSFGCLLLLSSALGAQPTDYSALRINEVIADNETQEPRDSSGRFRDMVEIFNSGDQALVLGSPNPLSSLALSDTAEQPLEAALWKFKRGASTIPSKGFLVVFLDDAPDDALACELYTGFGLSRGGCEALTLWGPAGEGGKRTIIDQVWLPPLEADVSLGRFPDGAGPAPVPIEETLTHLRFSPAGTTTFGVCGTTCPLASTPLCRGAVNGAGSNVAARIRRDSHSTNHPASGEPVQLVARVEDDRDPTPPNIKRAWIQWWAGGVLQPEIDLAYDAATGIVTGGEGSCRLERWTLWQGTLPGQPAGTRVDFVLHVEDTEGARTSDPFDLCPEGVGPCDSLGLPGPNCVKEPSPGLQYVPCNTPFRYLSGYALPTTFQGLVINEIVANQTSILADPSEPPADFEDFAELLNASGAPMDLSGLWLADKPFSPLGWQFPTGSVLGAGERWIIWLDADGGLCPRPPKVPGDGQKCPDPTDPARSWYHTNFALESSGDQLYLFDRIEAGLGVIHGVEFGPQEIDRSLCLLPDGDRSGDFEPCTASPGAPNTGSTAVTFLRGDANGDCQPGLTDAINILDYLFKSGAEPVCFDAADVDDNAALEITDPIFLLQYLFQGGTAPPAPGALVPGTDPTPDELKECPAPTTGCA